MGRGLQLRWRASCRGLTGYSLEMRVLVLLALLSSVVQAAAEQFDLVVYGGTAGGVVTAVSGAREGLRVVLLEPGQHLGGMTTGGLSRTDIGKREVIGGMALEFYARLGRHYEVGRFGQEVAWYFEPHVGEAILEAMLREAKVTVVKGQRLRERTGVRKSGARVEALITEAGREFAGRVFADCTYEGDLMAQAGVRYTWGREGIAEYGEPLAGVRDRTPFHQFKVRVAAFDAAGKLLPEVAAAETRGEVGAADKKVQAYNFRMILTQDQGNQVAFPKPDLYDARRYELLARLLQATVEKTGKVPRFGELCNPLAIPNGKTDTNNNGAFSTDFIGRDWEYPEGSYAVRARIWKEHEEYTKGFFYFLGHDARVPAELRAETNRWGLAKDEFPDTDHWPNQLYVREARRMVGEYVMVQRDLQTDLRKADAIGMGSYNSDSHNIQRLATGDGAVENEGDMQVAVSPYQIPYRVMLPKRGDAVNLLVPVCFSASHVAYSSVRMEPQYMILGHAAGVAAAMAVKGELAVQDVDVPGLLSKLRAQGMVSEYVARVPVRIPLPATRSDLER